MNQEAQELYAIPNYDNAGAGWLKLWLLAPGTMVGLGGLAYLWTRSIVATVEWALYGLVTGFVLALFMFVCVTIFFLGPKIRRLERQNWTNHGFSWYRETFPEHAHPNGHINCRHCGSHKTRVENMMNRTFMRVHVCAQCGETLYFSAEKR